ncbi:hypothetical protein FRX31_018149 [Thalictrum thalictroides]|uniref:Uncharacterized protein n=1 Tax=Thalictrum thalictroides TaxID=46969 RepID=A0A7J6W4F3_THATH|nr:hypothetical protein FRX31_018149 [Thalictrum thalictroides]
MVLSSSRMLGLYSQFPPTICVRLPQSLTSSPRSPPISSFFSPLTLLNSTTNNSFFLSQNPSWISSSPISSQFAGLDSNFRNFQKQFSKFPKAIFKV